MSEATNLLRLQELDIEYSHLKHEADNLPQKAQLVKLRAQAKKVASEITKIVGERKDLEIELNDLEVHKQYVTDKVTEVQNAESESFRNAQDMEYSLSSLAKKLEKIDFQSNQLMERLEKVERAERNARDLAQKLVDDDQDTTLSYKMALEKIAKQVKAITIERAELCKALGEEVVANYEATRKRSGGVAVETLQGNRPSACRVALQTSSYADIRRANKEVTTCPYCHRILVLTQESE